MAKRLEIRLLGPFEVLADGAGADVGGSKRQGLLALLALAGGRTVDVGALVDRLWGEDLPSAPRNAVQHHVARLRAALGEESIVAAADGYALAEAEVDALRFEALLAESRTALRDGDTRGAADAIAAALSLWRGAALQGLPTTEWFGTEAHRLDSLRIDALEEEFEVKLALGEHGDLEPALRAALNANPFRERLWGQLMLALYRNGRQAEALEAFQEARRVFDDELGLEPSPALRALQDAILSHDPSIAAPAASARRRGNLPAPTTSFVGREDDVARVAGLLVEHRLVTLIGPPGVGKSRLALEAARGLESDVPGGVWLVDLALAGDPDDAVRLLARTVDARGPDPLAGAASRLRDAHALVVLDACEHVLDAAGRIATALLESAPALRILATSREALHVNGEVRAPVEPLGAVAIELFIERARAARPGLTADDEAVAGAAEIVRRLDGLPLAIELTAARANVLGLREIAALLDERASSLRDMPASDPSRTALQELVEWSYDLLHADEKTLLGLLAVHRGGAGLASLTAVAAAEELNEATVAYLVSALVDKSIVSARFAGGSARYDMLDTVREYVLGQLAASGRLAAVRAAHAGYFGSLAEEAAVALRGPGWRDCLRRLETENDNLWAALGHLRDAPEAELAGRLGVLGLYFVLAGRISEGRRFLELVLAAGGSEASPESRIDLLAALCYCATEELDLDTALESGVDALALAREAGRPASVGFAQLTLSLALAQSGESEQAATMATAALAVLEETGDHWGAAAASLIRATAAVPSGDVALVSAMAGSVRMHAEAVDYDAFRIPGLLLEAWAGEGDEAAAAYRAAVDLAHAVGMQDHAAFALARLAATARQAGELAEAERLAREAVDTATAAGASWAAADARLELGHILAAAGDETGAASEYRAVVAWGREERRHEARESLFVALAGDPAAAAQRGLDGISASV